MRSKRRRFVALVSAAAVCFALASAADAKITLVRVTPAAHVGGTIRLTVRAPQGSLCGVVYQFKPGWARRVRPARVGRDGTITWRFKLAYESRSARLLAIVDCSDQPQLRVHYRIIGGRAKPPTGNKPPARPAGNWRGTIEITASASRPASGQSSSDGRDAFTYKLHAIFDGRRASGTEGPGWRGTATWSFEGVSEEGTRLECSYSGSGSYPVDFISYLTGGEGEPTRLAAIFPPGPGVGVQPSAMGFVTKTCSGVVTREPAFGALPTVNTYSLSLPPKTTSISEPISPAVRWNPLDLELATTGSGRMELRKS